MDCKNFAFVDGTTASEKCSPTSVPFFHVNFVLIIMLKGGHFSSSNSSIRLQFVNAEFNKISDMWHKWRDFKGFVEVGGNFSEGKSFLLGLFVRQKIVRLNILTGILKMTCASLHCTSIYNIPEPKKMVEGFAVDITVDRDGSSATVLCTTAHASICLRQTNPKGTDMLLVTIQLPSGRPVTMNE
ncbi:unnamed protein product [Hymenolepis diminuta]|uniref:Uncharacterized protein n=1 Tax=Hymenolepis diminuta TaxID=6216 RepID=A0A564XV34_HYMDI|nr:unnamed protein product [Hymenolepis diminuta]